MPCESLDGAWRTGTHSMAHGGCHVSTFPGRGVTPCAFPAGLQIKCSGKYVNSKRTNITSAFLSFKLPDSNEFKHLRSLSDDGVSNNSSLEEKSNSQAKNLQLVSYVENQATLRNNVLKLIRNLSRLCNKLLVPQGTMKMMILSQFSP